MEARHRCILHKRNRHHSALQPLLSSFAILVIGFRVGACPACAGWSKWDSHGAPPGGAISGPTAASWGANRLDLFVTAKDDHVWTKFFGGQVWSKWEDHGAPPGGAASDPAAVSWGKNRLDLFVRGKDNRIWAKFFGGQVWSNWQDHGAPPAGARSNPTAASWGANRLDLFVTAKDDHVWTKFFGGQVWSNWQDHGAPPGGAASDPAAVSWDKNRLDLFVRGKDNRIWAKFFGGQVWSNWQDLGAPPGGASFSPSVSSQGAKRLDLFVRGNDNRMWTRRFDTDKWFDWEDCGAPDGGLRSRPASASWGPGRIDCFVRGANDCVFTTYYTLDAAVQQQQQQAPFAVPFFENPCYGLKRQGEKGNPKHVYVIVIGWQPQGKFEPKLSAPELAKLFFGETDSVRHYLLESSLGRYRIVPHPKQHVFGPYESTRDWRFYWRGDPPLIGKRIYVFAGDANGHVWAKRLYAGAWRPWEDLGAPPNGLASQAAALYRADETVECFVLSNDSRIWTSRWGGGVKWSEWQDRGAPPGGAASAPAVASWGANRLDLFVRAKDDCIWTIFNSGQGWSKWENHGAPPSGAASAPAVASWGANRLDLFVTAKDSQVWSKFFSGQGWSKWENHGAPPGGAASAPTVASWGANRLDLFVTVKGGQVWSKFFSGQGWSKWENHGPQVGGASGPAVASWGTWGDENRLDLFVRSSQHHVWTKYFAGKTWGVWENHGAPPGGLKWGPACASREADFAQALQQVLDKMPHYEDLGYEGGHQFSWVEAIRKADSSTDFSVCNMNNDGTLSPDECLFVIVKAQQRAGGSHRAIKDAHNQNLVVDGAVVPVIAEIYAAPPFGPGQLALALEELMHLGLALDDQYPDDDKPNPPIYRRTSDPGRPQALSLADAGGRPVHTDPFHRLKWGWLNPQVTMTSGKYTLRPSSTTGDALILYNGTLRGMSEYFILENRWTGSSYDRYRPNEYGEGFALWHCIQDPSLTSNWARRAVHLRRAGLGLDGSGNPQPGPTLFAGNAAGKNYVLSDTSAPQNLRFRDGKFSGITVSDWSAPGPVMTVQVTIKK